uniref:LysR family transcriptional regulator n=1 Tax=Rodentolepis nana TaxID=102285 RepID=A0A0R3TFA6_RODNA
LDRGGIGVGTAETGLLELEAVGLRTSFMLVDFAGRASEAVYGPLTGVLLVVPPYAMIGVQRSCWTDVWLRQSMVEIFRRVLA